MIKSEAEFAVIVENPITITGMPTAFVFSG